MKVATYNANSIRARMPIILAWLEKERPDIFCIQETKVQDADFPADEILAAGWHVVFRGQKGRAGVAIISREPLEDIQFGFDDGQEPRDEARLIRARGNGVAIINTYVPQGRSADSEEFAYKLEWLERMRRLFETHYSPKEPIIWAGDFNVAPEPIDVHNPEGLKDHVDFHPLARQALAKIKEWGWVDLLREFHPDERVYTFWDYRVRDAIERGLGWRVDHIWATRPLAEKCTCCWVDMEPRLAERPSDHTVLAAEFVL